MTAFRKKPVVVQAHRWTGANTREVKAWVAEQLIDHGHDADGIALFLPRRSTVMTETLWENVADETWGHDVTGAVYDRLHQTWVGVITGQWIICGTEGEFYPCADDGTGHAPLNYEPALDAVGSKLRDCLQRGWTRHGHAIAGMPQLPPEPTTRARCGGAGLCKTCSSEAAMARP